MQLKSAFREAEVTFHVLLLKEYAELLEEFMSAVKQNYGEKVLIQVYH